MVVASGAAYGQTEEGLTEDVQLVLDAVGVILLGVGRGVHRLVKIPVTGSDDGLIKLILRMPTGFLQQVPGDMLDKELVIGQVRIKGPDQVVAVLMGMLKRIIELVTTSLGISNQIHPVAGPLFPEMRTL